MTIVRTTEERERRIDEIARGVVSDERLASIAKYPGEACDQDVEVIAMELLALRKLKSHKAIERVRPMLREHEALAMQIWRDDQLERMDEKAIAIVREIQAVLGEEQ